MCDCKPDAVDLETLKREVQKDLNCDVQVSCSDVGSVLSYLVSYLSQRGLLKVKSDEEREEMVSTNDIELALQRRKNGWYSLSEYADHDNQDGIFARDMKTIEQAAEELIIIRKARGEG